MFILNNIMEKLIEKHYQIIRDTPVDFTRSMISSIIWE